MAPRFARLFSEMRRRRVFRVAAIYAAAVWVLVQVSATISPVLGWPEWTVKAVLILSAVGFPFAVVLGWMFDFTQDGIRRTDAAAEAGPRLSRAWARLLVAAGAGFLLLGASYAAVVHIRTSAHAADRGIAVLPFANLNGDESGDYFSDGMTEAILSSLAGTNAVRVIGRSSVMAYKSSTKPIGDIGKELGVSHVLTGSVRRLGNRMLVRARLVSVANEKQLWAESYDRDLADVFDVQSDIARTIARTLALRLSGPERRRLTTAPTRNMEAYDLYLRGLDYSRRGQKDDNEIAIDLFKRSLAADPSFAEAYANLAGTYFKRTSSYGESQQWLDSAIILAKRSLALDKDLVTGHMALGGAYLLKGRFDVAIAELERASHLDPSAGSPLVNIGIIRASRGEVDAAIRAFRHALSVEPSRANIIYANLAAAYAELGLLSEATQATERAQNLDPDMSHVGSNIVWLALLRGDHARARQAADALTTENPTDARSWVAAGEAYLYAGDLAEAHARFSRAYAISADAFGIFTYIRPLLAYTSLRTGAESRGRELLVEFKDFAAQEMAQGNRQREVLLGLCEAHALSGERDTAIRLVRETIAAGWNDSWFLRHDPLIASIRGDPRFRREMAQLEVRVAHMRRAVAHDTPNNLPAARR